MHELGRRPVSFGGKKNMGGHGKNSQPNKGKKGKNLRKIFEGPTQRMKTTILRQKRYSPGPQDREQNYVRIRPPKGGRKKSG